MVKARDLEPYIAALVRRRHVALPHIVACAV